MWNCLVHARLWHESCWFISIATCICENIDILMVIHTDSANSNKFHNAFRVCWGRVSQSVFSRMLKWFWMWILLFNIEAETGFWRTSVPSWWLYAKSKFHDNVSHYFLDKLQLIYSFREYLLTSSGVTTGNRKPSGILQKSWTPLFKGRMQMKQDKLMVHSLI